MKPSQFNRLIKVLERIAIALEKKNAPLQFGLPQTDKAVSLGPELDPKIMLKYWQDKVDHEKRSFPEMSDRMPEIPDDFIEIDP